MEMGVAIGFLFYLAMLESLDQASCSVLHPGRAAERCLRHKGKML